jgi:hypothetical protein
MSVLLIIIDLCFCHSGKIETVEFEFCGCYCH